MAMTYAFALWSAFLLVPWLVVYLTIRSRAGKRRMLKCSLFTTPLGFTEPLFVPEYWSPPTLFDLAERTGFDLESLVFAFAVGGLAGSIYETVVPIDPIRMSEREQRHVRHRWHRAALISPAAAFMVLYPIEGLNPIYATIIAMLIGGTLTVCCRPDLLTRMAAGAVLFGVLYFIFFLTLVSAQPDYVEAVWRLDAISGVLLLGVPIEEILFALILGFLWSGAYEHLYWLRSG